MANGQHEARDGSRPAWLLAALILVSLLLSWAAFYNGYPLVFSDTSGYLSPVLVKSYRLPFYGLFVYALYWEVSPWPIVAAQAAIMAHLLFLAWRCFFPGARLWRFVLLSLLLASCTSLPWFVGQIMPDLFAAVVVLAFSLLAFCADRLRSWERLYLFLLLTGAVAVHTSHIALSVGLLLVFSMAAVVLRGCPVFRIRHLLLAAAPVALAVATVVGASWVVHGTLSLLPGAPGFLLARSYADGPARRYLAAACPQAGYRLCEHLDALPRDSEGFLWSDESPFKRLQGFDTLREEARSIVWRAFVAYPGQQLRHLAENTARQFLRFSTAADVHAYRGNDPPNWRIRQAFADSYPDYLRSRQSLDRLPHAILTGVSMAVVPLSALLCVIVAVPQVRRRQWRPLLLLSAIVLVLMGNAFVTGALSEPVDRYQSRLIWLLPFYASAALLSRRPVVGPGGP